MRLALVLLLLTACSVPAKAQLVLPGAVAPTPEGGAASPLAAKPKPRVRVAPRVPGEESVSGKALYAAGSPDKGQVTLDWRDKAMTLVALSLAGDQLSRPGEACRVDIRPETPLAVMPLGRPAGLSRYRIDVAACPIEFDVLDEALLARLPEGSLCTFKEADCVVRPAGLWGPAPAALSARVKEIEHGRTVATTRVQADFRALLAATKDRARIRDLAREQAAFSSNREETCRDYAREDVLGFCADRVTEARVAELSAALAVPGTTRPKPKPRRPKPVPAVPAVLPPQ